MRNLALRLFTHYIIQSTSCVSGTILGAGDTVIKKTNMVPALMEFTVEETECKQAAISFFYLLPQFPMPVHTIDTH